VHEQEGLHACGPVGKKFGYPIVEDRGSSEENQDIFVPKIGSKVIERYINAFGEIQTSRIFYDAFHAKMFAKNKIAHLCDNYKNRK
jgi:hypothetical protein